MPKWTEHDIPDQTGRTVLITGANSGLGLAAAGMLAARGARVLMACRSPERGEAARREVAARGTAELVTLDLADPGFERRRYLPNTAYGQAKLANLLFALELDRHAREAGLDLVSVAAHPGYTATNLTPNMGRSRGNSPIGMAIRAIGGLGDKLFGQNVRIGALPQVYAATAPDVEGGAYYGPDGLGEMRGHPHRVGIPSPGRDTATAAGLWTLSAELTKVEPDPA